MRAGRAEQRTTTAPPAAELTLCWHCAWTVPLHVGRWGAGASAGWGLPQAVGLLAIKSPSFPRAPGHVQKVPFQTTGVCAFAYPGLHSPLTDAVRQPEMELLSSWDTFMRRSQASSSTQTLDMVFK